MRSELLGRDVPVPTPEDFVLLKAAHMVHPSRRRTKAAQDALDIEAVARANALDETYVQPRAERLGLWDALAPLLAS